MIKSDFYENMQMTLVALSVKTLPVNEFLINLGELLAQSSDLQNDPELILLYGRAPEDLEGILSDLTTIVQKKFPAFTLDSAEAANIAEVSLVAMAKEFVGTGKTSAIDLCNAAANVSGAHKIGFQLSDVCLTSVTGVHPQPTQLNTNQLAEITDAAKDFLALYPSDLAVVR